MVLKGNFINDSEYICDLVRKDQGENINMQELKNAIDDGLQSGKSSLKIKEIIALVDSGEL